MLDAALPVESVYAITLFEGIATPVPATVNVTGIPAYTAPFASVTSALIATRVADAPDEPAVIGEAVALITLFTPAGVSGVLIATAPTVTVAQLIVNETAAELGPVNVTVSTVAVLPARGASVYVNDTRPDASVTEF